MAPTPNSPKTGVKIVKLDQATFLLTAQSLKIWNYRTITGNRYIQAGYGDLLPKLMCIFYRSYCLEMPEQ